MTKIDQTLENRQVDRAIALEVMKCKKIILKHFDLWEDTPTPHHPSHWKQMRPWHLAMSRVTDLETLYRLLNHALVVHPDEVLAFGLPWVVNHWHQLLDESG